MAREKDRKDHDALAEVRPTRRKFLKGMLAGGGAVALGGTASGLLAQDAPPQEGGRGRGEGGRGRGEGGRGRGEGGRGRGEGGRGRGDGRGRGGGGRGRGGRGPRGGGAGRGRGQ